jgi:hypothetical protein
MAASLGAPMVPHGDLRELFLPKAAREQALRGSVIDEEAT